MNDSFFVFNKIQGEYLKGVLILLLFQVRTYQ